VVNAVGDLSLLSVIKYHKPCLWIIPRLIAGNFIHYLYYAKTWDDLCVEIRNHHTVRDFYNEIGTPINVSSMDISILKILYKFHRN
jgi:hypothetical protein